MFADECEPLAQEIAFWTVGLENPDYPLAETGSLTHEICGHLRALAIMLLLSHGKVDRFHHNLIRSGRLRLSYLRRAAAEDPEEHNYVSAVSEPLFDAITAGDLALALQIANAVPAHFRAGHEYEDEHCFAQAVGHLVRGRGSEGAIAPLLGRIEASVGDPDDSRILICRALVGQEQADFDDAFDAFLAARTRAITADEARGELAEPPVIARREVYIEGLAMLRLAELRGFRTDPDYLYCPSLARQPMVTPYPEV